MTPADERLNHTPSIDVLEESVVALAVPASVHESIIDLAYGMDGPRAIERLADIANGEPGVACAILRSAGAGASSVALALESQNPYSAITAALGAPTIADEDQFGLALGMHCRATAIAGRQIALRTRCMQPDVAHAACLLHDIGKRAMYQAIPKAYGRAILEAATGHEDLCLCEQQVLGVNHCVVGRRLAQKWRLADEIQQAAWLHHQPADVMSVAACVAALADYAARRARVGWSGNPAFPADVDSLASKLGLKVRDLDDIAGEIGSIVRQSQPTQARAVGKAGTRTIQALVDMNSRMGDELRQSQGHAGAFELLAQLFRHLGGSLQDILFGAADVIESIGGKPCGVYLVSPSRDRLHLVASAYAGKGNYAVLEYAAPSQNDLVEGPALRSMQAVTDISELSRLLDPAAAHHLLLMDGGLHVGGIILPMGPAASGGSLRLLAPHFVSLFREVSRRLAAKDMEEKLVAVSGRMAAQQESLAAARAMSAIAEMAAGAAHEMNNPLAVISGRAQLMRQKAEDEAQRKVWQTITDQAQQISNIITELMEFASPAQPIPERVPVADLLESARDSSCQAGGEGKSSGNAQAALQAVDIEVADRALAVFADPRQAKDVLVELLRNAAAAGAEKISMSARQHNAQVLLTVTDDGQGMAPETLAKAFTPFFSHQRAGRRRGMGLSWARRYVELNGGRISIRSTPGEGTTVSVRLPAGGN